MDIREATLQARVKAVNNAHEYAPKLFKLLTEVFAPFVGQQIEKADGTLLAKIVKVCPELPSGNRVSVYRNRNRYSLCYYVKTCESIEGHCSCVYYECAVTIGDMENGTLKTINQEAPTYRSDYTPEEIKTKRQAHKVAQQKADEARYALGVFGESDR